MKSIILANKVQCNKCGRVLESIHRHDFQMCECGTSADGGKTYLKRSFVPEYGFKELSVMAWYTDDGIFSHIVAGEDLVVKTHKETIDER